MALRRTSSWRASATRMAGASSSHSLVEPAMSVNRKVTVPVGGPFITLPYSSLPSGRHYSSGALPGPSVYPSAQRRLATLAEHANPVRTNLREGDRRDSNPRSPEPQSTDICFSALPHVAELA